MPLLVLTTHYLTRVLLTTYYLLGYYLLLTTYYSLPYSGTTYYLLLTRLLLTTYCLLGCYLLLTTYSGTTYYLLLPRLLLTTYYFLSYYLLLTTYSATAYYLLLAKVAVDELFIFSVALGETYSGEWLDGSTFEVTVVTPNLNTSFDETPRVGATKANVSAVIPLFDSMGLLPVSTGERVVLEGNQAELMGVEAAAEPEPLLPW